MDYDLHQFVLQLLCVPNLPGFLIGAGTAGLLACLIAGLYLWRHRNDVVLDRHHPALIFTPDGLTMVLPKFTGRELDEVMPDYALCAAALGHRLMKDDEWRDRVVTEAGTWFCGRMDTFIAKIKQRDNDGCEPPSTLKTA